MPVVFITDGLIFFLIFMVGLFIWYARQHEYLRAPWRQVSSNSLAMVAMVVLFFYVAIGLLDSIHFHPRLDDNHQFSKEIRYSTEILSVFDLLVNRLRKNDERTYSAPLATHAYSKDIIEYPDGKKVRDYPRLKLGGAHLDNPAEQRNADVVIKSFIGMLVGLTIWLILSCLILAFLANIKHDDMVDIVMFNIGFLS